MTSTIVLVGCGEAKADEAHAARHLYTSTYFRQKRDLAELIGDDWLILSAKHGALDPDAWVEPYDVTIDDVEDVGEWAADVRSSIRFRSPVEVEIVLLAGRAYSEPVREALPDSWDVRRPFDDVDGGLFEQQAWLSDRLDGLTVEDVAEGKSPQAAACTRCCSVQYHDVVNPESIAGTAWQCSGCGMLRKTVQATIDATTGGGSA